MANGNSLDLNPWLSIWLKPKKTIEKIVDTNPENSVEFLAVFSGISQALNRASLRNVGDNLDLPTILSTVAIAGAIGGIIGLYVYAALIKWTGKWIGGRATAVNLRAALAWSSVPSVCGLLLWVVALPLFGKEMFTSETPTIDGNLLLINLSLILALIGVVIGIWRIIICLHCLGQVQGFSAWKALANVIIAFSVVLGPIVALGILISIASS